jgi:hypothetical protein
MKDKGLKGQETGFVPVLNRALSKNPRGKGLIWKLHSSAKGQEEEKGEAWELKRSVFSSQLCSQVSCGATGKACSRSTS